MDIKEYGTALLRSGFKSKASDLYMFPVKQGYELSFRHHHRKRTLGRLGQEDGEKLILYFKYLADMDVAEKRRSQVGSGRFRVHGRYRRLRFSTVGDFSNRESLVVRFLHDLSNEADYICLLAKQYGEIERELSRTGLYLFSGPTGSGKTTTMYRIAKSFEGKNKQVITIEDPVELVDDNFLQLQINQKIHLDYEQLVKVCLRHRPDILIVGEIRDRETAQAVIRGALTGHTIFSTIHGLNKDSIVSRLLELGVAAEELRQCLRGVVYQRLLPITCPYCQGECDYYCTGRGNGVLFDTLFFKEGQAEPASKTQTWQKNIQKAWLYGFITEEVYRQSC